MLNIGVLVSGGGTNLQALIDSNFNGKIVTVVSNNPQAYALERAKKANINTKVIEKQPNFSKLICEHMQSCNVDLIVLAGFLATVGLDLIEAFPNKIINVHPSLIPAFCGKGFYGLKVHEAVLDYGVKITGATVHFVNQHLDEGPIILQQPVEVKEDDTPETLQKRVMQEAEQIILPKAVKLLCNNQISVIQRKVVIKY